MNVFYVNLGGGGQWGSVRSSNHDLCCSWSLAARRQIFLGHIPVRNGQLFMEELKMLPENLNAVNDSPLSSLRATRAIETIRSKRIMAALRTEVRRVLRIVSMWQERIVACHRLTRLDGHVLRDIGLTRSDVERERMKPSGGSDSESRTTCHPAASYIFSNVHATDR
jgi:uncharacterized protein YjiS (DUF1127 family)